MRRALSSSQLAPLIYEAACEPELWTEVLEACADYIGADMASIALSHSRRGMSDVPRVARGDPDALRLWIEKYDGLGPWIEAAIQQPVGVVSQCNALVPPSEIRRTEFYSDIHPFVADGIGCKLLDIPSCFYALSFYTHRRDVDSGMLNRFEELSGHFVRAAHVEARIAALDVRVAGADAVLDRLPYAIFTCRSSGQVHSMNRSAMQIVERRAGLTLRHGFLRAKEEDDDGALHFAIQSAARIADRQSTGMASTLSLKRGELRRPLQALVAPLSREREHLAVRGAGLSPSVLVIVTDPEREFTVVKRHVETTFDLTPAESNLVSRLVEGATLAQFASEANITVGTARWTLKQVFAKTGAAGQVDLVRKVLRSVASLGVAEMDEAE